MKWSVFFLTLLLALALVVDYNNQYYLVPLALGMILFLDKTVVLILFKWKLLTFMAILLFGVPLFLGTKDCRFLGIPYNTEIFQMSLVMVYRSIIILMAIKIFTRRISLDRLAQAMQKMHLRQFSQVFKLALQIMPAVRTITSSTFQECRSDRQRVFPVQLFRCLVRMVVRIIQFAETLEARENANQELK